MMNWRCIFFLHDWSKWTVPTRSTDVVTGEPALTQDRQCNRCGKYQQRRILTL